MAEQQQAPMVVMQAEQKTSKGRSIVTIVLVIVLVTLGFYGYSYAASDIGSQRLSSFWSSVKTTYNPFYFYSEQLQKAPETGNIWGTKSNKTAEKIGIKFQAFESIGGGILPSGAPIALRYKLDVGEGVNEVPLKLKCEIKKSSDKEYLEAIEESIISSKEFLPTEEPRISTENPLSYSNVICQVTTKEQPTDQIINTKGGITFPFTQRNSLKVYFTKDTINIGNKFFEKEALKEKLPILPSYNNEPVELGIGVSDENIQPVVIGERQYPAVGISLKNRWDGKVTKIKTLDLILPEGVRIDKTRSKNPNILCPFDEPTSTGRYVKYSAEEVYLSQVSQFGKDVEKTLAEIKTYQRFFCWLEISDSILEGKPYNDKGYDVSVSYEYEFSPITQTVTLKGSVAEEKTTETPTQIETKYYLCQDKTTEKYSCVTSCTKESTITTYDNKESCETGLQLYQ